VAGALHVACAAEGSYVAHSAALLHSVAAHAGERVVHVHYLHGPRFPAQDAGRLEQMLGSLGAELSFHEIAPERVARLPVVEQFTAAMWYRIFLPELVPESDRVLYLDADTIVVRPLDPLWEVDLGDHYVAAVTNVFLPQHLDRLRTLGLASPTDYFNSGVLLLNLDAMRRDGSTGALHDYAASRGAGLGWPDQDTLNGVLGERRLPLGPEWNYMNSMRTPFALYAFTADELDAAARAPRIRHFEGPRHNKPWHWAALDEDRDLYRAHALATPWGRPRAGVAPELLRGLVYAKRRLVPDRRGRREQAPRAG
jgi:lipopolysaccharide biosynthesis glycosyltransferase